jgi:hypothetical protein
MPIDSEHPLYTANKVIVRRVRDAVAGEDAVKDPKVAKVYLPKGQGKSDEDYKEYLTRAVFTEFSGRTSEGLVGITQTKPSITELPEAIGYLKTDCDKSGLPITQMYKRGIKDIHESRRFFVLVDREDEENGELYLCYYPHEQGINWRVDAMLNPTLCVFQESYDEPDPKDKYVITTQTQCRELCLEFNPATGKNEYHNKVWRRPKKDKPYVVVEDKVPLCNGKPLDYIPGKWCSLDGLMPDPGKPPLLGVVNLNMAHYRNSADQEESMHNTACPTLMLLGYTSPIDPITKRPVEEPFYVGSKSVIKLPPVGQGTIPDGKYLEFNGPGLEAIGSAMTEKRDAMAALGARMLAPQKAGVEAAETLRLRQSSETSSLMNVVLAVEAGFLAILRICAQWEGLDPDSVKLSLNKEFVSSTLGFQEINSLFAAYQGGGISQDTFLWNLQEANMLPDDTTIEDEKALIDAQGAREFGTMAGFTPPTGMPGKGKGAPQQMKGAGA